MAMEYQSIKNTPVHWASKAVIQVIESCPLMVQASSAYSQHLWSWKQIRKVKALVP